VFYRWLERSGGAHHFILLRTPGGGFAGCTEATWNAQSPHRCWHNFTGVHLNTRLGFRPCKTLGTYQLERERLGAWLAGRIDV
jgi:hypothetical protein